ncbi:MAG: aminotransferase [Alphaproteobacteria bacterium]|nr:aminotransferase [Alphaproteobacteria bacterium]MBV9371110.1 aminotransferase [Alphaproteobacteria bacterium]MBV9901516.1 aminotransferase [Alphaproteobacteria bacterium]
MNPLYAALPTTVFTRMSALAAEHGAVNLGQGFPDFGWPEEVVARAAEALSGSNQYAPMPGLATLRSAVADRYRAEQGLDLVPEQVTVTSGATEALAAALFALITPGDEVLMFQPLYDAYLPLVLRAGGIPRYVRLAPPGWRITAEALDEAFTPRTRLVLFNNPHNPSARMFDAEELAHLARACVARDAIVLSDEVWEEVTFDGRRHIPLASLPGMRERTVKVGSAGKIFSLTGWKVGWAVAPAPLLSPLTKAHQFLTFSTPPNLQAAVAWGLGMGAAYFDEMRARFAEARDFLADGLRQAGFALLASEGTYFLSLDLAASGIALGDEAFCERAVREAGVAAIPVSSFYAEAPVTNVVRLCFAKRRDTLEAGIERLAAARRLLA